MMGRELWGTALKCHAFHCHFVTEQKNNLILFFLVI